MVVAQIVAKISCAGCGTRASPYLGRYTYWCVPDAAFLCRSCSPRIRSTKRRECSHCGSVVRFSGPLFIAMALLLAIAPLGGGLPGALDYPTRSTWQNMPFSTGPFVPGNSIKIHGTIEGPPGETVLTGTWDGATSGFDWSGGNFAVLVGSTSVLVDPASAIANGNFYGTPHSLNQDNKREYWAGDQITVLGTVGSPLNGTAQLSGNVIAPYPYSFLNWEWLAFPLGCGVASIVGLGALVAGVVITRRRLDIMRARWGDPGPRFFGEATTPLAGPLPSSLTQPPASGADETVWVTGGVSREAVDRVAASYATWAVRTQRRLLLGSMLLGALGGFVLVGQILVDLGLGSFWIWASAGVVAGALGTAGGVFVWNRRAQRARKFYYDLTAVGLSKDGLRIRTPGGVEKFDWSQAKLGGMIMPDGTSSIGLVPSSGGGGSKWSQVILTRDQMAALVRFPGRPPWKFSERFLRALGVQPEEVPRWARDDSGTPGTDQRGHAG